MPAQRCTPKARREKRRREALELRRTRRPPARSPRLRERDGGAAARPQRAAAAPPDRTWREDPPPAAEVRRARKAARKLGVRLGLEVRPSPIGGLGLFATARLPPGTVLPYVGPHVEQESRCVVPFAVVADVADCKGDPSDQLTDPLTDPLTSCRCC
jgi:hypothetical protein